MGKFIFDGPTLTIEGDPSAVIGGVFQFTAVEIYSEWIDWVVQNDNIKYPPAFSTAGGDPLGGGTFLGKYVFMRNDLGWRGVPPDIGDVQVVIDGNFYPTDEGTPFFIPWPGVVTVVQSRVSQMTQGIVTSGSTGPSAAEIASAVWQHTSATDLAYKMLIATYILRNKTVTNPTTGLMTVFADDGVTPYLTAQLYENTIESQPYRGKGAEVRNRLE